MFFSKKISQELTNIMIETETVEETKRDVLVYCFDYIIEQIIYTIIFLLLGLLFHNLMIALLFLLTFYPLRSLGGGIHASSERACTILSLIIYIGVLTFTPIVAYCFSTLWIVIFILSMFVIITFAPVQSPNKPLSLEQRKHMKFKCILYCIILILLFCIFYNKGFQLYYGTLSICAILIAISILCGFISNKMAIK